MLAPGLRWQTVATPRRSAIDILVAFAGRWMTISKADDGQAPKPPTLANATSVSQPRSLRLVASSPEREYEAFVREQQRPILNYLWRMLGDEQSAYDLTQEVFVRAWKHYEKLTGYDNPRSWLFRVATNLALSSLRGRKTNLTSMELLPPDKEPASSDPAWRVAQRDLVRAALDALPPRRRAALTLREIHGLSYAEIARTLKTTENGVRVTISRAREQFRTIYLREGSDEHGV